MCNFAENRFVLVACLIASTSIASASVELKFLGVDPGNGLGGIPLHYNGHNVTANVGQLIWDVRGESGTPPLPLSDLGDADTDADNFLSFCIELSQYVSGSWKTYEKTSVANASDPGIAGAIGNKIGSARATALDLLADNFWDEASGTDLLGAVSFQLAVWEIVHELGSVVVVDSLNPPLAPILNIGQGEGTFFVDSDPSSGTVRDAIDQANLWLQQLPSLSGNDALSVRALTHPTQQDQMYQVIDFAQVNDLPEPTSLLVWGSLIVAGCTRRFARLSD